MSTTDLYMKRIYDPPSPSDGTRILVDRLWPRGVRKENACVDVWLKEVAPSTDLRKWFHHDPTQFDAFRSLYWSELLQNPPHQEAVCQLVTYIRSGPVTLLFAAKDLKQNHVMVLRDFVISRFDAEHQR